MKKFVLFCCALVIVIQSFDGYAAAYSAVRPYHIASDSVPSTYEIKHYAYVIHYLNKNDQAGLKSAISKGLNVNARNYQGDTALCAALKNRRYQWANMLKEAGANPNAYCMSSVDENVRQSFMNGYVPRNGLPLTNEETKVSAVDWWTVGGVVGGLVITGGLIALAFSGGGGSSSKTASQGSANHSGNNSSTIANLPSGKPVSYPVYTSTADQTAVEYYQTAEFGGSHFPYAQNFLGQVNAQYAYAYAKAANVAVAGEGIIIGEMDTGVDYTHTELSNQIATDINGNKLGINFQYGPCRNGDKKNCWVMDKTNKKAKFYDNNENTTTKNLTSDDIAKWEAYESQFPADYDWDNEKNTPVIYGDLSKTHGTHVAGIMVAQKDGTGMHGLAYNSKLIASSVVFDWYEPVDSISGSFQYLVDHNVRVINNSWGLKTEMLDSFNESKSLYNYYFGATLKPALSYAAASSVASVFAAGNSAYNQYGYDLNPSIVAAAPMSDPSLLFYRDENGVLKPFSTYPADENKIVSSLFITVVALNENNEIAWYSQKCGPAAKWCIAAPGGDSKAGNGIVSTVASTVDSAINSTGYDVYQGTSMATPIVTSALAVIMAAFPSLTTEEAVALLFETATDLNNEDLYGHGLINLKAAMEPVGELSLATSTSMSGVPIDHTKLIVPHSFYFHADPSQTIMMLDKYKRGFSLPLNTFVSSTSHSKQAFAKELRLFTYSTDKKKVALSKDLSFAFADVPSAFSTDPLQGKMFALSWQVMDDIWKINLSFSSDNALNDGIYVKKNLQNPFTASLTDVYTLSNDLQLTDDFAFSLSGSFGKNNFFDGNEHKDPKNTHTAETLQARLAYRPCDRVLLQLTQGVLNEKSSMLGMTGYGAFYTKGSDTYFTGIEVDTEPVEKYHLNVGYYRGYTKGKTHNSFISVSDLYSDSMGVNAFYNVNAKWRIGMNIISPLSVRKGALRFNLPVARDNTDEVVYRQNVTLPLSSSVREWDYGLYAVHQTQYLTYQGMAVVRTNPDQDPKASRDYRMMISLSVNY